MVKIFEDAALDDIMFWAHNSRRTLDKVYRLIHDIERNGPGVGEGKPERLKYRPAWSRRIDRENRLLYEVSDNVLHILSCKGHYEE